MSGWWWKTRQSDGSILSADLNFGSSNSPGACLQFQTSSNKSLGTLLASNINAAWFTEFRLHNGPRFDRWI